LQFKLLVAFGVHEHQRFALFVEEGEILHLQSDLLDCLGRAETLIELGAVDQVLQLDLVVGAALAGLDGVGSDRHPQAAIMLDDVAGTDFVAIDLGHDDVIRNEIFATKAIWRLQDHKSPGEASDWARGGVDSRGSNGGAIPSSASIPAAGRYSLSAALYGRRLAFCSACLV
jgi:hypothetical protein